MLTECRIVVTGFKTITKQEMRTAVSWFENECCVLFGGFLAWDVSSGWKHNGKIINMQARIYDIACSDNDKLLALAIDMCVRTKQQLIYLKDLKGHVHFIKPIPLQSTEKI